MMRKKNEKDPGFHLLVWSLLDVCPEVLFCTVQVSAEDSGAHAQSGHNGTFKAAQLYICAPQVIQYNDTVCAFGKADTQIQIMHRRYSRGRIRI